MKDKRRIRVGANADLVVVDAQRVIDKSTYEEPAKPGKGMAYVLVNGVVIVKEGQLPAGIYPGRPVRAPKFVAIR